MCKGVLLLNGPKFFIFFGGGGLVIQILFHENLLLGILGALGWGFFSAMVAMTCTHDATHTHTQHMHKRANTHKPANTHYNVHTCMVKSPNLGRSLIQDTSSLILTIFPSSALI